MILENIKLSEDKESVIILDQTRLPNEVIYLSLSKKEEMFDAIYKLKVRGAPAIGIFAGFSLFILAKNISDNDKFYDNFITISNYLVSSRPTAVNLSWAAKRMLSAIKGMTKAEALVILERECNAIRDEDAIMCRKISEYGLTLIEDGDGILTHCNAGPLATSEYGTGLGALILGAEKGYKLHAYCDETRPLLQGARLTAYELMNAGIDTTLICDNMASLVMKEGRINACFVGCDRVAANGDTANKIGTSGVAILAKHYDIPFYVFCPSSTVDFNCKSGDDIEIELRKPEEISTMFFEQPIAPEGVKCFNPSFDVTDSSLITAIITEKGICKAPYTESLKILKGEQ